MKSTAFRRLIQLAQSHFVLALTVFLLVGAAEASPGNVLDLSGGWLARLDREDAGQEKAWYRQELVSAVPLQLPGTFQAQGLGDAISKDTPWVLSLYDKSYNLRRDYREHSNKGVSRVPFLCQPVLHYLGVAWVQREVTIPESWLGRRLYLRLERPRWETTVWVDDRKVGSCMSLVSAHEYELGEISPGRHRITVRLDNRMLMPYRPDAHAVSDSLGSTWIGIAGALEIRTTPSVWIEDARLFPNVAEKKVLVRGKIGNLSKNAGRGSVDVKVSPDGWAGSEGQLSGIAVQWTSSGGEFAAEIPLGAKARCWDEFDPALYRVELTLNAEHGRSVWTDRFGLREIRASGQDFTLNGRKIHLRGTHHGGDFPLTGYPPTDVGYWRWLFGVCRNWGLNHVRFHSFCPPEAAFIAADEIGMYLQPEAGMWNEISPGTPMEKMMYEESDRMLRDYGNHPSFMFFSPSNEPKGRWKEALPRWVRHYGEKDPRRLYTTGTGWCLIDEPGPVSGADYLAVHRIGQNMLRGKTAWFGKDYRRSLRDVNVPVASHELGQWCAYPDFSVIEKFTGYQRAGNYEIFRDSAAARGLLEQNRKFAWASGRFQLACYKEDIEANLRTPGLGGFQLLDLHDYTGQGTALVGVLDPFWEEKGYVTSEEWRRFCSETVPLARLSRRIFTDSETLECDVEISHYGRSVISGAKVTWSIVDEAGSVFKRGTFGPIDIPIGKGIQVGRIVAPLSDMRVPAALRLIIRIDGSEAMNDWNIWVYPTRKAGQDPENVVVTRSLLTAKETLLKGGRVVYIPRSADLSWSSPPLDSEPIFWNRLMNPGWGRMLGLWCDAKHQALSGFPTSAYCDWQWVELARGTRGINMEGLPKGLSPIVQAIDDWNRNWKLGLIFEARVGEGRLLVCAFDLERDLDTRPVARQLRQSILAYASGNSFCPSAAISEEELLRIGFDTRVMAKLGATAEASGQNAANAIDGDPNTFWISGAPSRGIPSVSHPHQLVIHFPKTIAMTGVALMNRQNDRNHQGDIRGVRIESSEDGLLWREVMRGELESTWEPQVICFPSMIKAQHLRLIAESGFGPDESAALAEIAVIYKGAPLPENDDRPLGFRRVRSTSADVEEGAPAPRVDPKKAKRSEP